LFHLKRDTIKNQNWLDSVAEKQLDLSHTVIDHFVYTLSREYFIAFCL